jgi:hypothetical protein
MPISFSCPCGKSYSVDDPLAGKRTRCPACMSSLTVPVPDAEPELVEDLDLVEDELEVVDDRAPASYGLADDRPSVPNREADLEPEVVDDEPVEDDGKPDYFAVGYDGSGSLVHKPRSFRVYPDGDELLFVHAGPFNWHCIDAAIGRDAIRAMAVRNSAMYGVAGAGLGLVAAGMVAVTTAVDRNAIQKRAAVLDPMTLDQIRAEVDGDKYSFRVNADNTTDAKFEPPSTSMWANKQVEANVVGWLRFTHGPTGKWTLVILTRPDARAAIKAFRRVLGRKAVDVELRLKKDRG